MDGLVEGKSVSPVIVARRHLAILAADVVDYSRLTESAEEETHVRLRAIRVETVDPCVVSYRGQIVKNTGDGFIAIFDSCVDALRCSMEIQGELAALEAPKASDRKIRFRMGLNAGDVIFDADDVYGSTVIVAARLEQQAPPGGILMSAALHQLVGAKIDVPVGDLGRLRLKNISQPVHAFSLQLPSLTSDAAAPVNDRSVRRAKVPGIAVLPFRTSGENPDEAYFGEGMVDDIIVALASIRGLLVIARTSALTYRSGPIDLQKISRELGVRYVLSGSVRRSDRQIRISSELVDVQTNSVIWADRYDGECSELFDLQDRIATRIVWSIAPHVREAELKRALRKRPENMNAYELLMQAIDLIYRMNFSDFSRAGTLLYNAISVDDNYAAAYAYAALWQAHKIMQGWNNDREADAAEAGRLAAAAIKRDPTDGFALAVYGHTKAILFRDYDAAVEIFDQALAAAPGNAMAWALSSGVYSYIGDGPSALKRAERGLRLSPVDTQAFFYLSFLALAHYINGNYDEAVIWARKSLSINPRLCASLRWLAGSLVAATRVDEARQVGRTLLETQPNFRLSAYAQMCPLKDDLRNIFIERLRTAGIPE